MTNKELEYNKRCAEFLDYKYYPHNYKGIIPSGLAGWQKENALLKHNNLYLCRKHTELPFSKDWNWLIEVVTRIQELGYRKYSYSHEHHSRVVFTDMAILYQEHSFGGGNIIADSGECSDEKRATIEAVKKFFDFYYCEESKVD